MSNIFFLILVSVSSLSPRSRSWPWPRSARSQLPEPWGTTDDARGPQGAVGAEDEPADPEAAQEAAEAPVPAERRPEESPHQEQKVARRG